MRPAVGFDLDMTLVDSAAGIVRCMQAAVRAHGGRATQEQVWPHVGIPLESILGHFLAPASIPAAVATYRQLYVPEAVPMTAALPGAVQLVDDLRAAEIQVLVVSAKVGPAVEAVLEHVGIEADVVVGERFADGKAAVLREHGAAAYVGDHPGDMVAAQAAGALGIGVTTGPHDAAALLEAGADEVVDRLSQVHAVLARHGLEFGATAPNQ